MARKPNQYTVLKAAALATAAATAALIGGTSAAHAQTAAVTMPQRDSMPTADILFLGPPPYTADGSNIPDPHNEPPSWEAHRQEQEAAERTIQRQEALRRASRFDNEGNLRFGTDPELEQRYGDATNTARDWVDSRRNLYTDSAGGQWRIGGRGIEYRLKF